MVSKNINQSVGMWELPCLKVSSLWKRWSEEGWLRMDSGKKKTKTNQNYKNISSSVSVTENSNISLCVSPEA